MLVGGASARRELSTPPLSPRLRLGRRRHRRRPRVWAGVSCWGS